MVQFTPIDPSAFTEDDLARFWGKVEVRGPGECWSWLMGKDSHGYGLFSLGGRKNNRKLRAHRVAYTLVKGEFPADLVIRHRCDNPPCCNPDHMVLGTKRDNSKDMIARGRSLPGPRKSREKLTALHVVNMRRRAKSGETVETLALEHGVHERTARYAISGKTWKSVDTIETPREWRP